MLKHVENVIHKLETRPKHVDIRCCTLSYELGERKNFEHAPNYLRYELIACKFTLLTRLTYAIYATHTFIYNNIIVLTFFAFHGLVPDYLCHLCELISKQPTHRNLRSSLINATRCHLVLGLSFKPHETC